MGLLIELYNIFVKPEAYGALIVIFLLYSWPKIKAFNKILSEYEEKVNIARDAKVILEKIETGSAQRHEDIYRGLHDYTTEIKLLLKDIQSNISKHDLTAMPNFDTITHKLTDINNETLSLSNKLNDQAKIVEKLIQLSGNVEKVDQLIIVLLNQLNSNNIHGSAFNKGTRYSNDTDGIKF